MRPLGQRTEAEPTRSWSVFVTSIPALAQGRLHSVKREHLLGVPSARMRGDATVPAEECLGEHDAA